MLKDLTGKTFGRLKVIERAENKGHQTYWLCECQCENRTIISVESGNLKRGRVKSCGCLYSERKRSEVPPNIFEFRENYKVGYTDTSQEFYYDIVDAENIEKHNWYFDKDGYVISRINDKAVKLHKFITNTNSKTKVDHINRIRHDNRRCNLRTVTNSQNGMNIKIRNDNLSGVTGVGWHKSNNCWRARITFQNKQIYLGLFDNFEDAVKVRHNAELLYFGEFSPLYNNQDVSNKNIIIKERGK